MIPWSFSWNNLRLRPLRTLLTVFSIAGGVAAVVAVLQAVAATRGQLDSMQRMLGEREVLDIVADDTSAFSISTLPGHESDHPFGPSFTAAAAQRTNSST